MRIRKIRMNYNIKHFYLIFLFDVSTVTVIVTVSFIVHFISLVHFIVHLILLLLLLLLILLLLFLWLCEIVIYNQVYYKSNIHGKILNISIFHTFVVLFKTITDVIGSLLIITLGNDLRERRKRF